MIYEAFVRNAGTTFKLVFTADNSAQAQVKAEDRLVAGDVLVGVTQLQQAA